MAESCLTYLNFQQIKTLSTVRSPDTQSAPFLYCWVYWGVHPKRDLQDSARSLALEVLKGHYSKISTKILLAQAQNFYPWDYDTLSLFSGLHCWSFFGIAELLVGLIKMECYDINEDCLGCGPLAWAARNGHDKVVKIIRGREEVNPDKRNKNGRTPLLYAAEYCPHQDSPRQVSRGRSPQLPKVHLVYYQLHHQTI